MALYIVIDGARIPFYPVNPALCRDNGNRYYADAEKRYFLKKSLPAMIANEVRFLTILQKYKNYFPRLVTSGSDYIVLRYIQGSYVTKTNIPSNYLEQINEIIAALDAERILHGDMHERQLLVENNDLFLIDFGCASFMVEDRRRRLRRRIVRKLNNDALLSLHTTSLSS